MDKYNWEVQYNDGTHLKQIDEDGTKHAYADIDRSKLSTFYLMNNETNNPALAVIFDGDGDKLVWTRRRYFLEAVEQTPIHIVGKKGEFILALNYDGVVAARHNFHQDGIFDEVMQ